MVAGENLGLNHGQFNSQVKPLGDPIFTAIDRSCSKFNDGLTWRGLTVSRFHQLRWLFDPLNYQPCIPTPVKNGAEESKDAPRPPILKLVY